MRIACVYAPHVPLQALVRRRPELRKQPVAVVSGGPASLVLACSRSAHGLGVRVGMSAITARQRSAEVRVELRDLEAEEQLEAAMVEALYGISSRVEAEGLRRAAVAASVKTAAALARPAAGGHAGKLAALALRAANATNATSAAVVQAPALAEAVEPRVPGAATLFCEVPSGMRGATFGTRVLEVAAALDVAVRVGIADDRFTAWVAAWRGMVPHGGEESPVVAVPRGGSAAFLAPQPLSLLNISPEVQQMLMILGVRTLGEFADLPAPSVARRWDCDLQALARGEGGAELYSVKPGAGPLREEVAVGDELSLGAAVALLAERVALRLAGRGGVAAAMEVTTHGESGAESVTLWLVPPLHQAEELADRIGRAVAEGQVHRLGVSISLGSLGSLGSPVAEPERQAQAAEHEGKRAEPADLQIDEALDVASREAPMIGMSGTLLRWSEAPAGLEAHRRTRRGKQRRRVVSAQARLFGE
jgi:impB/mucB/samB family